MTSDRSLFRAVDRGAFVVALGHRLRAAGVPVTFTAFAALTDALQVAPPRDVTAMYWLARVTLVQQPHDLETFDRVFDVVFREAALPVEGQAAGPSAAEADDRTAAVGLTPQDAAAAPLPWHTAPRVVDATEDEAGADEAPAPEQLLPERLPSGLEAVADTPLEHLDEAQLALVGAWLEQALRSWPTRRSRRHRLDPAGRRVALRATIARSRRTGWEPVELSRSRPVVRPRPVTLLVDVSQSMEAYSRAYLHVMRALARTNQAETFAFSTSLTRLTAALAHRSAEQALTLASELVVDRWGGTRLATSLAELLTSRHGNALRGGVLVVASDGWDGDPPELLARAMRRARLRAHRVVWLNPRAGAPGFEPLVGSMAAALPYCDAFLPAHTLRAVIEALDVVTAPELGRLTTTA